MDLYGLLGFLLAQGLQMKHSNSLQHIYSIRHTIKEEAET